MVGKTQSVPLSAAIILSSKIISHLISIQQEHKHIADEEIHISDHIKSENLSKEVFSFNNYIPET